MKISTRVAGIAAVTAITGCVLSGSAAAASHDGPAAGYSVRVVPVTQDWTDNCGPAAASALLSAFGIHASQDRLAAQMGTRQTRGTTGQVLAGITDDYLAARDLQLVSAGRLGAAALTRTLAAQLRARHPVMVEVWGNRLPWRVALGGGASRHWIVATGISGQAVEVFDPEVAAWHGGWHRIPVAALDRTVVDVLTVAAS